MKEIVDHILIKNADVLARTKQIAKQLSQDYKGNDIPLVVCVLKGAVLFYAELIQEIDIDINLDFIAISSYGNNVRTTGEVKMVKDFSYSVEGRDIIIVEDIIDTGITMNYLMNLLRLRGAKSVKLCSLLSKPSRREVPINIDYLGFEIPDEFVIGFGLDYAERYRNMRDIGVLKLIEE